MAETAPILLIADASGRAVLGREVDEMTPTVIRRWLPAHAPAELEAIVAAAVEHTGALLAVAVGAVVVHDVDVDARVQRVTTIVHDGVRAVAVGGGGPAGPTVLKGPMMLADVLADLVIDEIGGRDPETAPQIDGLRPGVLSVLRSVLMAPRASEAEACRRIGATIEGHTHVPPQDVLGALVGDGLVEIDDGMVGPGNALAECPALAAAAAGSGLVVVRMSLSNVDDRPVHDVRALEFVGVRGQRFVVLPPDLDDPQVGFARLGFEEALALLADHVARDGAPARSPVRPEHAAAEVPVLGAYALTSDDLITADSAVAAALAAPPMTVILTRARWGGGRVEGLSVFAGVVVGWAWAYGEGHALVAPADRLEFLLAALLAEQLPDSAAGDIMLRAARWADDGAFVETVLDGIASDRDAAEVAQELLRRVHAG